MKKFFSFVAAALFTVSMCASTIVITPDNSGWTSDAGTQNGTIGSVTIAVTKGVSNGQIRIYKNETLTISSTNNITRIEFICSAVGTTQYGPGCFSAQDGYSYEDVTGTWIGNAKEVKFVASANQVRATKITITTDGEGGDIVPVITDTLTCAEAAEAAKAGKTDLVAVIGYVTEYIYTWETAYPTVTFWMADTKDGGQVFQAYSLACATAEQGPALGDKVRIFGNLKQFNEISEINGGTFEIVEANGGENPNTNGGSDNPGTDPVLPEGYISVKQAIAAAANLADPTADNKTVKGESVKVRGYVTFAYDLKDGKQSAWVSDDASDSKNAIQGAFLVAEEAVAKGDLVDLEGELAKYYKAADNIIIEVINGTIKKATTDGIEDVYSTEKAVKVIENGQLIIIRNGVKFNAVGAVVE